MKSILAVVLIAGCGSSSGASDSRSADTVITAASITISGVATEHSVGTPKMVEGATIAAYRAADDSMVMSGVTDANGAFMLVVPTNGQPLDGYLRATDATYVDTFVYPTAPLTTDLLNAPVDMITGTTLNTLSTLAEGNEQNSNGLIAVVIEDATGTAVSGATVSSNPASAPYRYDGSGALGLPSSTETSTQTDGVAYMFNAPVGSITVSATKAGTTFTSHTIKSWADALTTTLITP